MHRLFWLAMGVTIGALLVRKVTRLVERMTPRSMLYRAADSLTGIADRLRDFGDDVRIAMREREAELRSTNGIDSKLTNIVKVAEQ